MDINGCHIVSILNADSADGFSPTVSRYVGFRQLPNPVPADAVKVSRGPFATIKDAMRYAQSWNDANNPPPISEPRNVSEKPADSGADALPPATPANNSATNTVLTDITNPIHTANAK